MDPQVQALMARSAALSTQYGGTQSTMNFGSLETTGSTSTSAFNKPAPSPSIAQNLVNIGHQAVDVGATIAGAVGHAFIDPIVGLGHNIAGLYDAHNQSNFINQQTAKLDQAWATLKSQRATMNPANYARATHALTQGYAQLSDQMRQNTQDMPLPTVGEFAGNLAGTVTDAFAAGKLVQTPELAMKAALGSKTAQVLDKGQQILQASTKPAGSVVSTLLKAPIKNVFNQATVQTPGNVAHDVQTGNYGDAALQVGLPAAGIGAAKLLPGMLKGVDSALYGNSAGPMHAFFGGKAINEAIAKDPTLLPALQQAEGFTLSQRGVNGDPQKGAAYFQRFMEGIRGIAKGQLDPSTFVHQYFLPYAQTTVALDKFVAGHPDGIPPTLASSGKISAKPVIAQPTALTPPSGVLPKGLQGAKPNYNYGSKNFTLQFGNDTTKALYIVGGKGQSASHAAYLEHIRQTTGMTDAEISKSANEIRQNIKARAEMADPGTIKVPAHPSTVSSTAPVSNPIAPEQAQGKPVKASQGITADRLKSAVVSADFTKAVPEAVAHINAQELHAAFGSTEHAQSVAQTVYDNLHLNNIRVRDDIAHAIQGSRTANEASQRVEEILTKHVIEVPGLRAPDGFIFTEGPNVRATMPKLGEGPALTEASGGSLKVVGNMLTKAGLSTRATSNGAIAASLSDNFSKRLDAKGIATDDGGKAILSALQKGSDNAAGSYDASSLTKRQIESALMKVAPDANPKTIRQAYIEARASLPASETGIAQKAFNNTLGRSPLFNKYLKVQAIGKFEANPIFWAKQDLKSGGIAAVHGWKGTLPSPETQAALKSAGVLSSASKSGEDASIASSFDTTSGATPGGKMMRANQQNIVGGLAEDLAKAHGMTVPELMASTGPLRDEVIQHLKLVTSYGEGGYLNSPMAKSLNMVIFPSRFATKVTMAASKAFSDQPPAVQFGLVHALSNTSAWLNSPEGGKWQKDNADFIAVVKYMTPLAELDNLGNFVKGGFHAGDLGQLGGLPVGVLATMLQHQGVNLGPLGPSQQSNPKTGLPYSNNIPQTDMARFQQAFTDLIGSMFSYPGATVGAPSKTKIIQGASGGLLKPAKGSTKAEYSNGQAAPASFSSPAVGTPSDNKPYVNATPSTIKAPTMQGTTSKSIKRGRIKTVPSNMIIR